MLIYYKYNQPANQPYISFLLPQSIIIIMIINKKENLKNCRLCCPGCIKLKESKKKDKNSDLARELKKTEEHESDVYTNYN